MRHVIVEADGGSRGNPGIAGAGALIRDDDGVVLDALAVPLGDHMTNNVAEYQGLIAGLRMATALDPASVTVRLDSKLVVEQMSGRWKIKHPDMQVLAKTARAILPASKVTYAWVPRKKNTDADALSNEAMDAVVIDRAWSKEHSAFCLSHGLAGHNGGEADETTRANGDEWDLNGLSVAELKDLALAVADELRRRR